MKKKGVTLIELMVVLIFMGIISAAIYQQFILQQRGFRNQQEFSRANIKARRASEYVVNELRHVGFCRRPLSPDDNFGIVTGTTSSISYTHDVFGNTEGVVDNPEDIHSIEKIGTSLFIDGDRASDLLDSLGFTYIDVNGDIIPATDVVSEVDEEGNWVMPDPDAGKEGNDPGHYPVNLIDYTVRFVYPDGSKKVTYHETVQIRNVRGPRAN
jgi:prepilin-type N-terminal cleavage/methylation domain-containing protein